MARVLASFLFCFMVINAPLLYSLLKWWHLYVVDPIWQSAENSFSQAVTLVNIGWSPISLYFFWPAVSCLGFFFSILSYWGLYLIPMHNHILCQREAFFLVQTLILSQVVSAESVVAGLELGVRREHFLQESCQGQLVTCAVARNWAGGGLRS